MNSTKYIIIFIGAILFSSCIMQIKVDVLKDSEQTKSKEKIIIEKINKYKGWWVYGEDQHIFKDEESLEEYNLEFQKEDMKELKSLYLAVCQMEYFPMECSMEGYLKKDSLGKENILIVSEFEILYIEGCGE